jgi:hypothetical protein
MATFGNVVTRLFSGIHVQNTGMNNDADLTTVIDAAEYGIIANRASIVCVFTAGSSACDVAIQGSIDNINWTDIITAIADDTPVFGTTEDAFRYYRVDVTTIGSGNTMDVYWLLAE